MALTVIPEASSSSSWGAVRTWAQSLTRTKSASVSLSAMIRPKLVWVWQATVRSWSLSASVS